MLTLRMATADDAVLLYNWANEKSVRENSYKQADIDYNSHLNWFNARINSQNCFIYIFSNEERVPVGVVRIEKQPANRKALISISVAESSRGKGYSSEMIEKASADFLQKNAGYKILAYVFKHNEPSYRSFIRAGYELMEEREVNNIPSYILYEG